MLHGFCWESKCTIRMIMDRSVHSDREIAEEVCPSCKAYQYHNYLEEKKGE